MSGSTNTIETPARRLSGRRKLAVLTAAAVAALGLSGLGTTAAVADSAAVTNINGDYTVPQGGQWTFEATDFDPYGTLDVYLDSTSGTSLRTYDLDGSGDAGTTPPDYTRVPIASGVSTGSHTLYFVDDLLTTVPVSITVTTPAAVSVSSSSSGTVGGNITVSGSGWITTNPSGSAIVALKIEDATNTAITYNHISGYATPGTSNLTVWLIVNADSSGNFSATVHLPDGGSTGTYGSSPTFGSGAYKIQALAGSLQTGDRSGSTLSNTLTIP